MTDNSRMTRSSAHVPPLSFSISTILGSSSSSSATMSHLSYGSALTAAAIAAAAQRAYMSSAAAIHHTPSSSSSSSAAVAAASLWAAAAAVATTQRHTFIPGLLTSSSDHVTSTNRSISVDTLMPHAAIFPWMQERKDRLSGGYMMMIV